MEGILRQAADVEEVDRRVQEYEQGLFFKMLIIPPFFHLSFFFFSNDTEHILSMLKNSADPELDWLS